MASRPFACTGPLAVVLAVLCVSVDSAAREVATPRKTPKATRQYNTAIDLHNRKAYESAAAKWSDFLTNHKDDPRVDRAWHYLGICYSKQNQLENAAETFEIVVKTFPDFDLLADAYLNLGLTQYHIAQAGKPKMYNTAAKTFRAPQAVSPQSAHWRVGYSLG